MGNLYKQMFFVGLMVILIIVSLVMWITASIFDIKIKQITKFSDSTVINKVTFVDSVNNVNHDTIFLTKKDTVKVYIEVKPTQHIIEPPVIQKQIIQDSFSLN